MAIPMANDGLAGYYHYNNYYNAATATTYSCSQDLDRRLQALKDLDRRLMIESA